MEKINKNLRSISNSLAILGLLQITNLFTAFDIIKQTENLVMDGTYLAPEGISPNVVLLIIKLFCIVPVVLEILVLFFLSVKGRREADKPSSAKFHIILAAICAVFYALIALETAVGLFNNSADLLMNLLEVLVAASTAVLLFFYFKYTKKIRKQD